MSAKYGHLSMTIVQMTQVDMLLIKLVKACPVGIPFLTLKIPPELETYFLLTKLLIKYFLKPSEFL